MPAQGNEAELLRRKTADNESTLTDEAIELLFDEAESDYVGYDRKVVFQAVVIARLDELYTASIRKVTYKKGETTENLSDMAKAFANKLADAKKKLDDLIVSTSLPALRTAVMKPIPSRRKSYPNG